MKKQILLALFVMCSMGAIAVTLPSNSYSNYSGSAINTNPYVMETGTTIVNSSTVGAYGTCIFEEYAKNEAALFDNCSRCCWGSPYDECRLTQSESECDKLADTCVNECQHDSMALGDSPLDAPTAFLLALVAAYGAVAVYRRKMQQA